jgi:hypothetical protein
LSAFTAVVESLTKGSRGRWVRGRERVTVMTS